MTREEIFDMLEQASQMGVMVYNIWATEPLLRKDLPSIIEYAHSLGISTSMITNGVLLEKRIHELTTLDYLSVSIDGIESYGELRGYDVQSVLRGIRLARKMDISILMNTVISGQNLNEIEKLVKLAQELDTIISFEPITEYPSISNDVWDEIGIRDMDAYHATIDHLILMKREGFPIMNSLTYLKSIRDLKPRFRCKANELIMHVSLDGRIESCREKMVCLG